MSARQRIPISVARPSGLRLASEARQQVHPGDIFARLTVLGRAFYAGDGPKRSVQVAVCQCECGAVLVVRTSAIASGATTSCGCFQRDQVREVGYRNRGQKLNRTPAARAKVLAREVEVRRIVEECQRFRGNATTIPVDRTLQAQHTLIPSIARDYLPALPTADARHIPDHAGYAVTESGNVFGCRVKDGFSDAWHAVRPWPTGSSGYLAVSLHHDGRRFTEKVYRLVLKAFVGPPPKGCVACHMNGDTSDNSLANLRWDTPSRNANDKNAHGTMMRGEAVHCAVIDEPTARVIKALIGRGVRDFEIARELKVDDSIVRAIRRGITWKHVTV